MILQGHLFSNPMIQGWKDQVKVYSEDKTQWEKIKNEGINESTKQFVDFAKEETVKLQIDGVASILLNSYPFPDNFLALMKTK